MKEGEKIMNNKAIEVFGKELRQITDERIRQFTETMLNKAPEYFYRVAASSTGKYHPRYCLGDGGLVRHTKAAFQILMDLFNNPIYDQPEPKKSCMQAAILLHDITKHGLTEERYSRHDHPVIVRQLVPEIEDAELKTMVWFVIIPMIESHMGPWTDNPRHSVKLPRPSTEEAQIIHLADYLASRKSIEVVI